jgi:uncharacterized membrane protein
MSAAFCARRKNRIAGFGLVTFAARGYSHFVMFRTIFIIFLALLAVASCSAQDKTADAIKAQIHSLKADRSFTLTYDKEADSTKLMAVAPNFDQKESERAGAQAINFACAFTFPGKMLLRAPESVKLTFWVMAKKPRFAAAHNWIVAAATQKVDLGEARYAARPSDNMEYLNFVVSRDDLKKIAVAGASFKLGYAAFTFTAAQTSLLANLIALSTP